MKKILLPALSFFTLTSFAFADTDQTIQGLSKDWTAKFMSGLIPLLVLVGLVTFLIGVVSYVRAGDNEEKRTAGRQVMTYGIVVLFIMMAYWGFVGLLTQSFLGEDPKLPNYLPGLMNNK